MENKKKMMMMMMMLGLFDTYTGYVTKSEEEKLEVSTSVNGDIGPNL